MKSTETSGGNAFAIIALIIAVCFLLYAAQPLRYTYRGRNYLCWRIPNGEACVEAFTR